MDPGRISMKGRRLTESRKKPARATMPKRTPDIARDLNTVDKKSDRADAQVDQKNRTPSDNRMVTKSIPPSKKLMARNGDIAAKNVVNLTVCATSLPITTRRGDSAVTVTKSSVCS